jgi:hypothetical protein
MHLLQSEVYWQLVKDAHNWRELAYESAPAVVYLGLAFFAVLVWAIALTLLLRHSEHEVNQLRKDYRELNEINKELHGKVDAAEFRAKDAERANAILCEENDRLRGIE